jgi:UDP-3-O-[3-hydroxymyristoyl] glucosamine N-acyltransferase
LYKVKDVIDFLKEVEGIKSTWLGNDIHLEQDIFRVNTDQDAVQGDLAWISPRQAATRSEKSNNFRGSLLIGPESILMSGIPFISCNKPKLAFIEVVNHFFSDLAKIEWPSIGHDVHQDSVVDQSAILAPGVIIGSGVSIKENVVIGPNTVIANTMIYPNVIIGANCSIGLPGFGYEKDEDGKYCRFPHVGRVIIKEDVEIGSNTCVDRGSIGDTIIGRGVKVDNLVHIAHNVRIGANAMIIANSMLGGSATIGEDAWVAPSVSVMNQTSIGKSAVLGMGAVVLKDVEDLSVMVGNPAKLLRKESK